MTTKTRLTACVNSSGFCVFMKDEGSNIISLESRCSDSEFNSRYHAGGVGSLASQCKEWSCNTPLDIKDCSPGSHLASFSTDSVCSLFYQDKSNSIIVNTQVTGDQEPQHFKFDDIKDCLPGTSISVSVQNPATAVDLEGILCYQSSDMHLRFCKIAYIKDKKTWKHPTKIDCKGLAAIEGTRIAVLYRRAPDCIHVFFQNPDSRLTGCTIKDDAIDEFCMSGSESSSDAGVEAMTIQSISALSTDDDTVKVYLTREKGIEEYLYQAFTKPEAFAFPTIYEMPGIAHMQVVRKAKCADVVFYLEGNDSNLTRPQVAVSHEGIWKSSNLTKYAMLQNGNGSTEPVANGATTLTAKPGDDEAPISVVKVCIYYTAEIVNNVVVHYSDQTKASLFNRADEPGNPEVLKMKPGEELSTIWIQSNANKTILTGVRFATSFARTTKWCGARSKTRVQPQFINKNTFDGWSDNFRESFSWGTFTTCMDVPRIIASLEVVLAEYASSVDTICSVDLSVRASVGVDKAYHLALVERLAGRVEYLQGLEDSRRSAVVAGKDSQSRAEDLTSQARSCRETLEDIWRDFYRWFEVTSGLDLVKENLTSDLIVLEDHILLWKKEALLFMDKQIKELGARVEDANTRLKDASKPHAMPSGSPRFCMCSVKEFDSGVAKNAEERRDQAYELLSSFDSRFSGLAQGVRSIKDKLDKWEVAKQDVPQQSVLEPPKSYEGVKEPDDFKLAFQEIWKSAKQDRKITESLPSRANSPVEYLLGGSMNEPSAN